MKGLENREVVTSLVHRHDEEVLVFLGGGELGGIAEMIGERLFSLVLALVLMPCWLTSVQRSLFYKKRLTVQRQRMEISIMAFSIILHESMPRVMLKVPVWRKGTLQWDLNIWK